MSFFFSSRRRHTRLQGDWSSDVCSSDLAVAHHAIQQRENGPLVAAHQLAERGFVALLGPRHDLGIAGAGQVARPIFRANDRSEEHTSELQSPCNLVCRLLLEKKKTNN